MQQSVPGAQAGTEIRWKETKFPRCPDVGASKFPRLNDWAVETSS
jgi:hypothetical protein